MSIADATATLGYGFALGTDSKVMKLLPKGMDDIEDLIANDPDLEFGFAGDAYSQDGFTTFLLIKESVVSHSSWEDKAKKVDPTKMQSLPQWDIQLQTFAQKHKIKNPKIG